MRMRRLGEAKRHQWSLMLACLLWMLAIPVSVRAAGSFSGGSCYVQSVTVNGTVTWQIRGTASVTGVVPANAPVMVTVKFQTMPKGATQWSDMSSVDQTTNAVNGTANIDTGFVTFTPAPGSGDQYRILLSGSYGQPPLITQMQSVGSPPVTPVP